MNDEAATLADLGGLTKPLRDKYRELEAAETRLTDELKVVRDAKRRVRKTLASLNGTSPTSKAKAKATDTPAYKRPPSGDSVQRVLVAIKAIGEGATLTQIAEQAGVHATTVRKALDVLRERDEVRYMGEWREEGAKSGAPAKHYAPMGS